MQDQLLELQGRLRKTILFVTHDVEEALKLADEIIVLDKGRLVQKDTPCNLLANPASDFVRQLLNTDDRIRQLSLVRVEMVMKPLNPAIKLSPLPQVPVGTDLKRVLSLMLSPAADTVLVTHEGKPIGCITFEELRKVGCLSN